MNKKVRKFKVLWTGGWDSTFRIVELSRQNVIIQPIYVCDYNRKSVEQELSVMKKILEALQKHKETKATFQEIKKIKIEDIPKNEKITKAYKKINKETGLGIQHEWLARLGQKYPGMEIGTEKATPETNRMINSIQKFAKMDIIDGIGIINKEESTEEGRLVLGWFRYPIITKTEQDMLKIIKEWHYEDVMKLIWFCHTPINGEACGLCHPCHVKMESQMEFLLNEKAIKHYKNQLKINKMFGTKMSNLYTKIIRKISDIKNYNKKD